MLTARQIFQELNESDKTKVMDYLKDHQTSKRIFRNNFTKSFWEDLKERRDSKIIQHCIINCWGATGCLSGDTKLLKGKKLSDYKKKKINTLSYDFEKNKIVKSKSEIFPSGKKELFEIELVDGRKVLATIDHRFFVVRMGMILEKRVDELRKNDNLVVADG